MSSKRRRSASSSEDDSSGEEEEFVHKYDENLYEVGNKKDREYIESLDQAAQTEILFDRNEERELAKTVWEVSQSEKKKNERKEKLAKSSATKGKGRKSTVTPKRSKKASRVDDSDSSEGEQDPQEDEDEEEDAESKVAEAEVDSEVDSDVEDDRVVGRGRKRATRGNKQQAAKEKALSRLKAKRDKSKSQRDSLYDEGSESEEDKKESDAYEDSDNEPRSSRRDDDDDDEDDSDEDNTAQGEMDDMQSIRLSRFKLEKWIHQPFFEKVVKNCFVRVSIGANNAGSTAYRCAEIIGVEMKQKAYQLDKTKTKKALRLRHGNDERPFRASFVSNQPFTTHEFRKWKEATDDHNMHIPTMKQIENKKKEIEDCVNYVHKDMASLQQVIETKKDAKGVSGHLNSSMLTLDIEKKIKAIELQLKEEETHESVVEALTKEIEEHRDEIDKIKIAGQEKYNSRVNQFSHISEVNKRNALIDRNKAKYLREQYYKQGDTIEGRAMNRLIAAGIKTDVYKSRQATPQIVSMVEEAPAVTAKKAADKKALEEELEQERLNEEEKERVKKMGVEMPDLDLELDVDIDDDFASTTMADPTTKAQNALNAYKLANGLL